MDGKALLKALMKEAKLNPNALADILKNRSLQSQITRFTDGSTRNPRWETLKPVADYFGIRVEAFFDSEAADLVARQRGFLEVLGVKEDGPVYIGFSATPRRVSPKDRLHDLLLKLASEIEPHDQSARRAVSSLLADLALSPENASIAADRIVLLLHPPEKEGQPRFINSQAK